MYRSVAWFPGFLVAYSPSRLPYADILKSSSLASAKARATLLKTNSDIGLSSSGLRRHRKKRSVASSSVNIRYTIPSLAMYLHQNGITSAPST